MLIFAICCLGEANSASRCSAQSRVRLPSKPPSRGQLPRGGPFHKRARGLGFVAKRASVMGLSVELSANTGLPVKRAAVTSSSAEQLTASGPIAKWLAALSCLMTGTLLPWHPTIMIPRQDSPTSVPALQDQSPPHADKSESDTWSVSTDDCRGMLALKNADHTKVLRHKHEHSEQSAFVCDVSKRKEGV